MKRSLAAAAIAIAFSICAAAALWFVHVRDLASAIATQSRAANDLLAANTPSEALASALVRPGLHIFVIDRQTGVIIDSGRAGIHTLPAPRAGPQNAGPPEARPPGELREGPPPGAPRPGPFANVALALARIPPTRIDHNDRTVEISPDARDLTTWLTADTLALLAAIIATVTITATRTTAQARAQRDALETRAAEHAAAAERYQRFLAEAGHELRTPLTVLAGYVDIMRAHPPSAPIDDRVLEGMHAETLRMRALVEKMLTLARLESDAAVPRLLDIADAAREAAATLHRRYPARKVHLNTQSSASIVIDADDFAAALGNLLENAAKYAPASPITLETTVADHRATIAVIDTGPGIPPAEREAIFEQFHRAHEGGDGLGLGLAIVKRVAERWGGTVTCESGEGRTVFRLAFPLADEEPHALPR